MLKKFVAIAATLALSVVPATTTYAADVYEQPGPFVYFTPELDALFAPIDPIEEERRREEIMEHLFETFGREVIENNMRGGEAARDIEAMFPRNRMGELMYPDDFGGMFYDLETGNLVVLLVEDQPGSHHLRSVLPDYVIVHQSQFSYNQLNNAIEILREYFSKYSERIDELNVFGYGLGEYNHRLVVQVFILAIDDEPLIQFADFTESLGLDRDMFLLTKSDPETTYAVRGFMPPEYEEADNLNNLGYLEYHHVYDTTNNQEPDEIENGETYPPEYSQNIPISPHNTTTLNPGSGILNSMHGGGWSVGYRAVDQFGRLGFVTAAHGLHLNTIIRAASNGVIVGAVEQWQFSGPMDAAFVVLTGDVWVTNSIGILGNVSTAVHSDIRVNQLAYVWGNTTGPSSGIIMNANYDYIAGGVKTTRTVTTSINRTRGGDSGGLVFRLDGQRSYTMGIHLGLSTSAGTTRSVFSPAHIINSHFGLWRI